MRVPELVRTWNRNLSCVDRWKKSRPRLGKSAERETTTKAPKADGDESLVIEGPVEVAAVEAPEALEVLVEPLVDAPEQRRAVLRTPEGSPE